MSDLGSVDYGPGGAEHGVVAEAVLLADGALQTGTSQSELGPVHWVVGVFPRAVEVGAHLLDWTATPPTKCVTTRVCSIIETAAVPVDEVVRTSLEHLGSGCIVHGPALDVEVGEGADLTALHRSLHAETEHECGAAIVRAQAVGHLCQAHVALGGSRLVGADP